MRPIGSLRSSAKACCIAGVDEGQLRWTLLVAELAERIRAFIAIRVSDEVVRAIDDLIVHLRSHNDGIKWVAPANLHLTLKFLGPAVPVEKIQQLRPELERVAAETHIFDLDAAGVGGFPDLRHPHVLWVGLRGEGLKILALRIEDATTRCGFEREQRPFNGHLTIGRVKRPRVRFQTRARIEDAKNRNFGTSTIREMTLYRSITTAEGSLYEALAKFQFKSPI